MAEMDQWFADLVKDIVWKGVEDALGDLDGLAAPEIEKQLAKLSVGDELSASPLVAVVSKKGGIITFLVRGRFNLFGGAVAPFMRIQVRISLKPPFEIQGWDTVVGDLLIEKADLFTAQLAFGYDDGVWLGRGAFKFIPGGFGLDLLLGGIDEDGLAVAIEVDLPSPIPLGSSGLVLTGVGGSFAYNFVPSLGSAKKSGEPWDVTDYVKWAGQDPEGADLWGAKEDDDEEITVGVGLRADLGDLATLGWLLSLQPIGLAILSPGPLFILGGPGNLLNRESIALEGNVAVDIGSKTMALGLSLDASEPPKDGNLKFLEADGSLDAFFSWERPSEWYARFGTTSSPVNAKLLDALGADVFLMLGRGAVPNTDGTMRDGAFFGVGIAWGKEWDAGIVYAVARIGADAALAVGWNPLIFGGSFAIYGELGLTVWDEFGLKVVLQTDLTGYLAQPTMLKGQVNWDLDLPWPIPDVGGKIGYTIGESGGPPVLKPPLLVGTGI